MFIYLFNHSTKHVYTKRNELEQIPIELERTVKLAFLAFLIFQNELKPFQIKSEQFEMN